MSTDFRPTQIVTLATTDNAIAGWRAIRCAAALTYKFARKVLSEAAKGQNFLVAAGGGVSANVDRQNATPAVYFGDGETTTFAINTLNLKATFNGRQGVDTNDAAGVTLRTYASGYALASGEVYKVKVNGVLKTVSTDYTVSSQNIVFVFEHAPSHGAKVEIFALSSVTPLGEETIKVTVAGALKVLTTDYTIVGANVIFEAGDIPAAGERVCIFFRTPGTAVFNFTAPVAHANSSSSGALVVSVNDGTEGAYVVKTADTDYTVTPWGTDPVTQGFITFITAKYPADGLTVKIEWKYAKDNKFTIPVSPLVTDDVPEVWIDGTKKTVTTDYAISNNVITLVDAAMPTVGKLVEAIYVSKYAGIVPAGGVTFLDTRRENVPAWDYIRAGGSTVVEVM